MTNQPTIHQAKLHIIIFLWPLCVVLAPIYASFHLPSNLQQFRDMFYYVSGFGGIWIIMTWVTYQFSSLTIKPKQVILRTGLLVRQTIDIPLDKIESIDIRQSLIGSLLKYGELTITGTGGTRNVINYLCKPLTCRRVIEQQMHQV
ncbi:PH domain-containing protein [Legionella sp. W05-934-2]|jgi:uncharacterized membrane protein YdbT with pleckstrin-like domain|uniref:PH domain-containing protein n=1 Tax=Legionella sp. W05-934-2 TaxID=1198649 RepID=UPI0034635CD0